MMRFIPKKFWFCIIVGMLMFQGVTWGTPGWSWAPAIEVNYLWKQYDQEWFHISQSCNLSISAEDYDSYNDVQQPHNWISYALSEWSGDFVSSQYGQTNSWSATHFTTSPDDVYVMIRDDPDCPDGYNTDDSSKVSPIAYFNAWEVVAAQTVDGSSESISESGYGNYGTSTTMSDNQGLDAGPVTVDTSPEGTDDGPDSLEVQVDVTWEVDKMPTNATSYAATASVDVDSAITGTIEAATEDEDDDSGITGSIGISVSFPGTPFGVGISFSPDIDDTCESLASIGLGFDSDELDSIGGNEEYTVSEASSETDNDGSKNFALGPDGTVSGLVTSKITKGGQIYIKGYVDSVGLEIWHPEFGYDYWNSNASIESDGGWCFQMNNPSAGNLYLAPTGKYIYPN
ncbi:MAG: hypothetical protein GY845_31525 [Planctomycetes bacterium]|nr:hypothetical protein [Planctomycetota bacterium]